MTHELLPWMLAIGKYILASAVLLTFYRIYLRKNATYKESRVFLLSVAFLALAVSQFRIEVTHPAPTIVEVEQQLPEYSLTTGMSAQTFSAAPGEMAATTGLAEPQQTQAGSAVAKPEPKPIQNVLNWIKTHPEELMIAVYLLVAFILLTGLLLQYIRLRKLRRTGMSSRYDGYTLVEHPDVSTPFSFSTTIFLPSNMNANQRDIVVTHERWHINHKHHVDVLVQEITCCLFWFNPIQWLLRKDLRSVHEFQADRSVLNEGFDVYRYQTIILEEVLGHHFRLANGFNQSFTKKRFIQMKQFEPIRLTAARKGLSVCFIVLLFAALSVMPGKSQVIRVERSSTTSRTENGTTTSVTFRSVDTLPYNPLSSSISIDPNASPSQLQQSYSLSLDSQQRMVNRVLPIVRKLARSPHPADDVSDMNALLKAMNLQANKQVMNYSDFSAETKKSLTQQDFQDFEKTLMNMNDSIKLFRTYKVDGLDSPYLMKPMTLPLMFLSDKLTSVFLMESFSHAFGMLGGAMEMMDDAMKPMDGSMEGASNGNEAVGSMGEAFGELGKAMGGMISNMTGALSKQTVNPVRSNVDRTEVERQPSTQRSGKTEIRNLSDQNSLAYIARNDNDRDVRVEAMLRLTDQNTLAYVARNDREPSVRRMAIQRLTDQNTLAYVARNDNDRDVKVEAIIRLTDQNTLAFVARNDREPSVRRMAVQRLTDQNTLAYVARNDNDKDVRIEAIARMEQIDTKSNRRQPR